MDLQKKPCIDVVIYFGGTVQVPGTNAAVESIKGFAMHDPDAVEAALKAACFCVVARRAGNAGATAFYMTCKTGILFFYLVLRSSAPA
jgi:hypothetical protein